ncbi:MAG: DMT family transporter [Pyrinomonadaceae bacterium]
MRLRKNLAADGALVLTTLVWGSTFVMAKDVLERWPPVAYLAFRFALAALILLALFGRRLARAGREEWKAGAALGVLIGAGFAFQTVGQVYTTPSNSAFITGLTTPLVPFIAFLLLRVRPNFENLIGVVLASIGGVLILAPKDASVNVGDLLTLGCTALFATHITLLSVYSKRFDARQLTVLQITVAASIFVLIWLCLRASVQIFPQDAVPLIVRRETVPLVWSVRVVWQEIYLAIVATVGTFLTWTWAQGRMSATHAAIIFSLEPVFATLIAVIVRGSQEWAGGRANWGALLILAGVVVSELRLRRKRESVAGINNAGTNDLDDEDIRLEAQNVD